MDTFRWTIKFSISTIFLKHFCKELKLVSWIFTYIIYLLQIDFQFGPHSFHFFNSIVKGDLNIIRLTAQISSTVHEDRVQSGS